MFGMSLGEVFFIVTIAVIVLGPDKLPSAIKSIAKLFNQLKSQTGEVREIMSELQNEANKITDSVSEQVASFGNLDEFSNDALEGKSKTLSYKDNSKEAKISKKKIKSKDKNNNKNKDKQKKIKTIKQKKDKNA